MPERGRDDLDGVRVTTEGIDTTAAVRRLASGGAGAVGAVVSFAGVVRADRLPGSSGVEAVTEIEFECFPEMAEAELGRIRAEAIERFALSGLVVVHRTGRLKVGEEIVLVAAAARHRQAAFEAAAWVMDRIKERVPLWKREHGDAGGRRWVEGRRSVG
ncbi:MAG: molybdenum cofactor biosynthesis protein MoaE [Euryarchaeota archaeon]|nr:molybdenum cofactor biosynthesis protein MoaE [Euryarchaeota archaeon]